MSMIRSKGTSVNKEITSKETRLKSSGMCKSDRFFMRSKLLFVRLGRAGKFRLKILCRNEAKLCKELPVDETMILSG